MGAFSVIIEELEDIHLGAKEDTELLKLMLESVTKRRARIVHKTWTGNAADAYSSRSFSVTGKLELVITFMEGFTNGVQQTLDYLRELDERLSNPVSTIQDIFGF